MNLFIYVIYRDNTRAWAIFILRIVHAEGVRTDNIASGIGGEKVRLRQKPAIRPAGLLESSAYIIAILIKLISVSPIIVSVWMLGSHEQSAELNKASPSCAAPLGIWINNPSKPLHPNP